MKNFLRLPEHTYMSSKIGGQERIISATYFWCLLNAILVVPLQGVQRGMLWLSAFCWNQKSPWHLFTFWNIHEMHFLGSVPKLAKPLIGGCIKTYVEKFDIFHQIHLWWICTHIIWLWLQPVFSLHLVNFKWRWAPFLPTTLLCGQELQSSYKFDYFKDMEGHLRAAAWPITHKSSLISVLPTASWHNLIAEFCYECWITLH